MRKYANVDQIWMIGLTGLAGYCSPAIRNVEDLLRDQGQAQVQVHETVFAGE